VFGLFGAFLVLNRHLGRSSAGMYATILINAVIGFVVPGIAWQAHLGGILTGAAAAYVIARTSARERRRLQWPGLALLVVLLVVLALAKYAIVPAWAVVG
jgi:membrane associated rhomboid family serine protease